MALSITVKTNQAQLEKAIATGLAKAFDQIEATMRKHAERAAWRVRENVAGAHTDDPVLRFRSGEAFLSIDQHVRRRGQFKVHAAVGAINASPEVTRYLTVQEYGATITPKHADKLAFPPGEDWHPATRDPFGEQVAWASDIMNDPQGYGFSNVFVTDDAILGEDFATGQVDLLFIRRDHVTIPARYPVGREMDETVDDIELDILDIEVHV